MLTSTAVAAVVLGGLRAVSASMLLQTQLDLGGDSWTVTSSNGSVSARATVPGEVHTDLLRAGIIPEPFAGFNELGLRWVALDNWTFSRQFTAPAVALDPTLASTRLVFDGLDTVANITLNGRVLGTSANSFVLWQAELPAGLLRAGTDANELVVRFTCAQCYGQAAAAAYPVPLREFRANRYSYSGRPWVRKSQTHFGWNWGPGFITQGIYRGARLEVVRRSAASIDSVLVQQTAAGQPATSTLASPATGDATVWPPLPTPTPTNIAVELGVDVRCAPSGVLSTLHLRGTLGAVSQAATVVCPLSKIETVLSVSMRLEVAVGNVAGGLALWYPNGYGKQQLHNLTVQLCDSVALAGSCATPWSTHLGLRVAEVVQDPLPYTAAVNDTNGPSRSMYWRVNGQPVWGKGANNIPSDQFESRVTPERLWSYLTSARDAHMTTLRVWGGGLFERDEFYEFCDQLGLLIYHDMMWSDQIYPWHTPFLKTAADETRYQVRRLSRHASLVLWSLTNELLPGAVTNLGNGEQYPAYKRKEQWAPSGGNQVAGSFIYTMGAQQLFFGTVARVIQETDTSRTLMPTSPSNGWLSEEMLIPDMCIHQPSLGFDSPACFSSNPARGDGHFYTTDPSVAFNASRMLPPLKFCTENGAESWPSIGPISTVTEAPDRWIGSPQMQFRERAGSWGPAQVDWVRYHFGAAPIAAANRSGEPDAAAFHAFVTLSQLATGLGLSGVAQQFRFQKSSVELGATMGHLLWQLQDNWPGQSFGLLNYGGEWKQQLHFVRRSFAPLLVTAAGGVAADGSTAVTLISDLPSALHGCTVEATLWKYGSVSPLPLQQWNVTVPLVAAGGTAHALALPKPDAHTTEFIRLAASCRGVASGGGGVLRVESQGEHFFPGTNFAAVREHLLAPDISASGWSMAGTDCTLKLSVAAPALFVVPSSSQLEGRFSDSAFALVPGELRQLGFKTASGAVCNVDRLRSGLEFTSLHSLLTPSATH